MLRFFRDNDLAIAVILLSYWCYLMISAMWGTWSIDMSAIYMAGHFAHYSAPSLMYSAPPDLFTTVRIPEYDAFLSLYGLQEKDQTAFIYPPIWAYVAAPFANRVDPITFFNITRIAMTLSFAAAILATWRFMAVRHMSATVFVLLTCSLAFLTMPAKFAIFLNQPHLILTFLILLAFERYLAGWKKTAGIILGLVAAVKVTPVLLALIFVADRDWRALGACLITAIAIMGASFAVAGVDLHLVFLERVAQVENLVPMHGQNLTFETMMHDFFVPLNLIQSNIPIGINTPWVATLSKILLVVALASILWVTRCIDWADRVRVRLFLLYTAMAFFGPLAWMHYYMLTLLMIPAFGGIWRYRSALIVTGLLVIGFSSPVMMAVFNHGLEVGGSEIFHSQHTALLPLALFCVLLPYWMQQNDQAKAALPDVVPVPGE